LKYAKDGNLVGLRRPIFDNLNSLMTVEDVAIELHKSPKTIRNWIAARRFPAIRIGNRNMVRRRQFEMWLERQEIKP
jgi:excisionase family DNA binding protein